MIDLHCHILPGVDDGADSMDTALSMAAMAARSGVETIVTTPHCNTRDRRKNYRSRELEARFGELIDALEHWRIPVRLAPGAEVLVRGEMEPLLEQELLMPLAGSRYLLVEFYFDEIPSEITRQLRLISRYGYVPLIAHPERYFCVQDEPGLVRQWISMGCAAQINKGSVLGSLGEGAYQTAELLLNRGLCHALASDAHHYRYRSPDLDGLVSELEQRFPRLDIDRLLQRNPARILADREIR